MIDSMYIAGITRWRTLFFLSITEDKHGKLTTERQRKEQSRQENLRIPQAFIFQRNLLVFTSLLYLLPFQIVSTQHDLSAITRRDTRVEKERKEINQLQRHIAKDEDTDRRGCVETKYMPRPGPFPPPQSFSLVPFHVSTAFGNLFFLLTFLPTSFTLSLSVAPVHNLEGLCRESTNKKKKARY